MSARFPVEEIRGVGVHTGTEVGVRLRPGEPGSGWRMVRQDLAGSPGFQVHPAKLLNSNRATTLGTGEASVQTCEHLLAALWWSGLEDVRIEVCGPEIPILDGSALPWAQVLGSNQPRIGILLADPCWIKDGDAWISFTPAKELQFTYTIQFPKQGEIQRICFRPSEEDFFLQIAPARTFILKRDAEILQAQGGLRGGSLDCALVWGEDGWINPPARFPDEPVRHKILDLIGDLALLGAIPRGHYAANNAGHWLHGQLACKLAEKITSSTSSEGH